MARFGMEAMAGLAAPSDGMIVAGWCTTKMGAAGGTALRADPRPQVGPGHGSCAISGQRMGYYSVVQASTASSRWTYTCPVAPAAA